MGAGICPEFQEAGACMGDSKWEKGGPPCPGHFSLGRQDDNARCFVENRASKVVPGRKIGEITSRQ
jgi:hypothetical protein